MRCARCGNSSLVPTSLGWRDDLRSVFGSVRYRCIGCNHRQLERLWPAGDFRFAHCPRCFSASLQRWSPVFMKSSTTDWLKRLLGGRSLRCLACSHAFTSWRRPKPLPRVPQPHSADAGESPCEAALPDKRQYLG